ncbi:hypothetical protein [Nonomuraea lactucae]|uniref:hypothetical protein n=1 Tax=Nonomuraea lactucae TaxID=2249762 RepID=UPI0013B4481E|nr:hypothetical protein [Nonomuraea lactucae]
MNSAMGWAWAAELTQQVGGRWLFLWEPGGQHLTAFYGGDTPKPIYRKAKTPQEMWSRIHEVELNMLLTATAVGRPVRWPMDSATTQSVPWEAAG